MVIQGLAPAHHYIFFLLISCCPSSEFFNTCWHVFRFALLCLGSCSHKLCVLEQCIGYAKLLEGRSPKWSSKQGYDSSEVIRQELLPYRSNFWQAFRSFRVAALSLWMSHVFPIFMSVPNFIIEETSHSRLKPTLII